MKLEKVGYQSKGAEKQVGLLKRWELCGRSIAATLRFCLKDGLQQDVTMMIAAARWDNVGKLCAGRDAPLTSSDNDGT